MNILMQNLPEQAQPEGVSSQFDYLALLVKEGAARRYKKIELKTQDLIDYELKQIKELGWEKYILICHELVDWAKKNDVFTGPGRNTSADSIVLYCLGITEVDPIQFGECWWRFASADIPAIDIDFEYSKLDLIYSHLQEKYGVDCVARVGITGTDECHACGVVITKNPVREYTEIIFDKNVKSIKTVAGMEKLNEAGLIKFNFLLGLKVLDFLNLCEKEIQKNQPDFKVSSIPLDDDNTIKVYNSADTHDIFQFDGEFMQNYLRKLKADSFEKLYWLVNFRHLCESRSKVKDERLGPDYSDEALFQENFAEVYLGYVSQEELIRMIMNHSGCSGYEAEIIRQKWSKNRWSVDTSENIKERQELQEEFIKLCKSNGKKNKTDLVVVFQTFYFCSNPVPKAHMVAYTKISWWCAYIKTNYRTVFDKYIPVLE